MRTNQPSSSSQNTKCSSDGMKEDHYLFKEVDSDECGENVSQTHPPLFDTYIQDKNSLNQVLFPKTAKVLLLVFSHFFFPNHHSNSSKTSHGH